MKLKLLESLSIKRDKTFTHTDHGWGSVAMVIVKLLYINVGWVCCYNVNKQPYMVMTMYTVYHITNNNNPPPTDTSHHIIVNTVFSFAESVLECHMPILNETKHPLGVRLQLPQPLSAI